MNWRLRWQSSINLQSSIFNLQFQCSLLPLIDDLRVDDVVAVRLAAGVASAGSACAGGTTAGRALAR
jgi:hypothetical protein